MATGPEFLKAATMRPYGRAKFFRDCARFGFLNKKMHNLPLFYLFGSLFKKICCFLALFVCAKLLNRNIGRAKQIVFRKSACGLISILGGLISLIGGLNSLIGLICLIGLIPLIRLSSPFSKSSLS